MRQPLSYVPQGTLPRRRPRRSCSVSQKEESNKTRNFDIITYANFVAFEHGRHMYPGRFFVAEILKLTLARIIV
jgi:hypothetical protein